MKANVASRIVWVILIGVILTGCAAPLQQMQKRLEGLDNPQLKAILQSNITAMGGLEVWAEIGRIDGHALATIIETDGGRLLLEQQHHLAELGQPDISILSHESDGEVIERLKPDGKAEIMQMGRYLEDDEALAGAKVKLQLLGHVLTAGPGLLRGEYVLHYLGTERKGGRLMNKIEAIKPAKKAAKGVSQQMETVVFWINGQTSLVERIWMQYVKPGGKMGYLAVYASDYRPLESGITLSHRIEYLSSDAIQQFSEKPIYIIEYQDIKVLMEGR